MLSALKKAHPYEEVAYELYALENINQEVGSGMIGELKTEMDEEDFLHLVKNKLNTKSIRHTKPLNKKIKIHQRRGGGGVCVLNAFENTNNP